VTRLAALLAALVVPLFAAACGGESKGDVVAGGDEICRAANDKLAELEEPEDISGLPAYAREALPIVEDAVADLKALDPPDQDRKAFDRFIEKSQELEDLLKELAASGSGTPDAELEEASDRIGQVTQESNAAAEEYGFQDCAEE
jgi:hypothetical protein